MQNYQNENKITFINSEDEIKNFPLLIPKLKSSFKLQKELITEIEQRLQVLAENPNKVVHNPPSDYYIKVIPNLIKELGISFAHSFILNPNIYFYLLGIYFDDIQKEEIVHIFKACMDIFSDISYNDELNQIREYLKETQIIEDANEIINIELNDNEKIYQNINIISKGLKDLIEIGQDKEKFEELNKKYLTLQKELKILNIKTPDQFKAEIEFLIELTKEIDEKFKKINLSKQNESIEINEAIENKKEDETINIPLDQRTFFYFNEKIKESRNEVIEFKTFSFPLSKEDGEELKRQYCGFLNSQGGRLYIGINSQNIVKGVELNSKTRDNSRNNLVNLTFDFYPNIRLEKIKVYYIPVKDRKTKKFINRRYVVKIRIFPGDPEYLYSMTSKGYHSTIRRNNQYYELNSTEIYNQIIQRDEIKKIKNQDNVIIKESDIRDPDPEINYDEEDNEYDLQLLKLKKNNSLSDDLKKKIKEKYIPPKKINKNKNMVREGTFAVKITNIDENVPINDINRLFNGHGQYSQKILTGHGFVNFNNAKDANNFIEKFKGTKIGNKNIRLSLIKNE